ncbi:hypothetical protein VTK73DRAFT_4841 [Phialemonium thermophilum]|uniref:Uncharacterized protein n=1 Tax=Phialemonium thermophilum TaxID=223376 RepID=A0ABR3V5J4_9PEZI
MLISDFQTSYDTFRYVLNMTDMDASYDDPRGASGGPMHPPPPSPLSATSQATVRRLRRTRQRLGSYRHDLVVAMRVVNGVERELVQAEWENFLADENVRCERVREVLARQAGEPQKQEGGRRAGTQRAPAGEAEAGTDGLRREDLWEWHQQYCGSCAADQRALLAQRGQSLV